MIDREKLDNKIEACADRAEYAEKVAQNAERIIKESTDGLGQVMGNARKTCDISLRECAKLIGCSAAHLSDMERGNRTYASKWIIRMRELLLSRAAQMEHGSADTDPL